MIVPGIPQKQRPHQRGIVRQRLLLHRHRQPQILHPVGMAQSTAVAAHDEGELRRRSLSLDLRHHLHLTAVGRLDGVPVDIQHEADGRILLQIPVDPRQRAVIGPGVLRIVIQGPVMEHGDPRLSKYLCHGVPHANHIVPGVRGAVVPGPDDAVIHRRGIALAAVAVQNQDLRRFAGQLRREGLQQLLVGEGILGGVSDVDLPADGIAAGVCGDQGLCRHAVVCPSCHRSGLGLLPHRLGHRGGAFVLRFLRRLTPQVGDLPAGGKQDRRLTQHQHGRRRKAVPLPHVP